MKYPRIFVMGVSIFLVLTGCTNRPPNEVLAEGPVSPTWQVKPEDESSFDIGPKFIAGAAPIYPISQLRHRKSGKATIGFTIDAQGRTHDFRVISADYSFYGSHAIAAVQRWQFEPARKNGRAVAAQVRVTFDYRVR